MGLGNYVVNPASTPPCGGVLAAGPCQSLYNAVSNLPSDAYLDTTVSQVSEELRLTSKPYLGTPGEFPFTWVTGAYYSSEMVKWTDDEYIPGLNAAYNAAGLNAGAVNTLVGWSPTPPANVPGITYSSGLPFPDDEVFEAYRHYLTQQIALFGDLTGYVTPALRLSAGLRYLYAYQEFDRSAGTYWNGNYVIDTPPTIESYALTPKFALDWDITADDTVYSTISKGYRLGDVNRPVPVNECILSGTISGVPAATCANSLSPYGYSAIPNAYKSDSLWNFEVGDKARLFGNRLSMDLSAFFIRWTNLQQTLVLPQGWDFVVNTGVAHIYGVEWDIRGQITPGLTLSTSGSVNHAVIVNSGLVLDAAGQPYTNAPVEGVPDWNGKVAAEYKRPLVANVVGMARFSTSYTGQSHGTFTPGTPDYYRSPYAVSDMNLGADIGSFEVSLFVTNLFDNRTIIQRPNIQLVQEVYRLPPRIIGISANYAF
jgi:iron complex outermembrane recepter protein